ncbi:MAG: glycoside hydrolase family 2 protein, partial [Bacteroidetes bacterium]|nr:glycoside hydrolase family 2 protein [Bacteroidota bacterium]
GLIKKSTNYIPEHGTFVTTDVKGNEAWVNVQTSIENKNKEAIKNSLEIQILDAQGKIIGKSNGQQLVEGNSQNTIVSRIKVSNPTLWSIESPYLYKVVSTLKTGTAIKDQTETILGIRTVVFDAQKGFLLNGKPVKIKGVCMHQDHAGVGVALPDRLQYYRIEKLKEMGCNAYRSAHHPPTPELLDACDRLGMLVMDENRLFTSSPEFLGQFERLILRDRNHPSVIIWSLGNEEHDMQNKESGRRIAETFKTLQQKLDPSRLCTYGGNNGNNYTGANEVVDVRGVNYMNISDIDKYHKDHPEQPIWGSEEASTLCTRGQYAVDKEQGYMSDYDKKENIPHVWCSNAEEWWKFYDEREWLAGAFIWTGFDYRGEPSPYQWPCINSHFGVMDVCGFPKNNYYYYKAWWTNEDVLHIYPHWNWAGKGGEKINVWCQTNCQEVELFLNGKSLGKKTVQKNSHIEWDVVYEPGVLEARGIRNGKAIVKKVETTGTAASIVMSPDRLELKADGNDVSVVNISVLDVEGREVPDANNFITFKIEGNGKIIGVGNGDPSSHEPDKILKGNYHRKLFNGKCQVIVQSTNEAGTIKITAISVQLKTAEAKINTK